MGNAKASIIGEVLDVRLVLTSYGIGLLTHRIEMVQRSAARYVQNNYQYTSSVTNMLRELKVVYSEQRRNQASLTMPHKILTGNKQVNVDHSHLTTTQNNKFLIPHSKTN